MRVLVVDDSAVCREVLRSVVEGDGSMMVVAEAASGVEAIEKIRKFVPDVVTMDVRMPGIDGLATIERLMSECPRPVLVVTDLPTTGDGALVFEATRRGALDVAEKPNGEDARACAAFRERLRQLARVPVVRHVGAAARARPLPRIRVADARAVRLVAVAASAGGPAALSTLLAALPASFGACVALTQHLPPGFALSFARYLASRTSLRVVVGDRRLPIEPGTLVVASDVGHLVACGIDHLTPSDAPARGGHRPSADVSFESIAASHGAASVGVVLTGIGKDGAAGLLRMRDAGATTIAQDAETCAVFGMPKAAAEIGAARYVLPLGSIADALLERTPGGAR